MPRNSNQKLKLIYLQKILLENTDDNHFISMDNIIKLLNQYGVNAERKSVYADIEALYDVGIEVELIKGKNYGYHVLSSSRAFELVELKLLVDSIQSSKFLTVSKSNELINKLEHLASIHEATELKRQVLVANRVKNENESIYYNVDDLHKALSSDKQISFDYYQWIINPSDISNKVSKKNKKDARYVVSPWCLTYSDENYYLIAFEKSSNKIKHFRVDKIERIEILDSAREGKGNFTDFNIGKYSNKVFSMYGGEEVSVKLQFSNDVVGVVLDKFGKETFIQIDGQDHFIIKVDVMLSPTFYAWIFTLGEKATIVSPQNAVKQYKKHIKKATKNYK